MEPHAPYIRDLGASFSRHLRAANRTSRTINIYNYSIRFFCEWLEAQGRVATLDQLTRSAITAWTVDLAERVDIETVRMRLRGMRRFCRWLAAEGEVDKAPTEGIQMPARLEKPVRIFTDDEIKRMLKTCAVPRVRSSTFDRRQFYGRRDEAMLRLLIDCGLRVSELVGLTLENLDMNQEVAYVVGKGRRPRAVPFCARTAQSLDRYLRVRALHSHARQTDALILAQRGPLTVFGVRWRLGLISAESGVEGVHPHAFRHTFAHRWLSAGGQERDLMRLAGWRSESMLGVYARTTADARAHEAHRRMGLGNDL